MRREKKRGWLIAGLVVAVMVIGVSGRREAQANEKGLVAWWSFDEGRGKVARDKSGNGNDGVISGAQWVKGKFGSGLRFDGKNDYVSVPHSVNLNITDAITIEMWVKFAATPDHYDGIIDKGRVGLTGFGFETPRDKNELSFYIRDGIDQDASTPASFNIDEWNRFAGVYSDTENVIRMFKNGIELTPVSTSRSMVVSPKDLYIGWNGIAGRTFHGVIDEVKIYNKAFNPAEEKIVKNVVPLTREKVAKTEKEPTNFIPGDSSFETGFSWKVLGFDWEIDNVTAADGEKSLKLIPDMYSKVIFTASPKMPVVKGEPYVFSIYAKANNPALIAWISLVGPNIKVIGYKKIPLTTSWRRYSIEMPPQPVDGNWYAEFVMKDINGDFFQVETGLKQKATYWIDAAQFERGEKLTAYESSQPIFVNLSTGKLWNIYYMDEPIILRGEFYNATSTDKTLPFSYRITDYYGKELKQGKETVKLKAKKSFTKEIKLTSKKGFFSASLAIEEAEKIIKEKKFSFGVVSRPLVVQPEESPFGVAHVAYADMHTKKEQLEVLSRIGVKWGANMSVWHRIQPNNRDEFIWDELDRSITLCKEYNMGVMNMLWLTPDWATSAPPGAKFSKWYGPKNLNDYTNFVYQVVNRYKDWVKDWEIWGEPDLAMVRDQNQDFQTGVKNYIALVKAGYAGAKKADPNCRVHILSVTDCTALKFAEAVMKEASEYFDVMPFHPYAGRRHIGASLSFKSPEEAHGIGLEQKIKNAKELIAKYGSGQKLEIGEYGYGLHKDEPVDGEYAKIAANYLVRSYVIALANGVDKLMWHLPVDSFASGAGGHYGLFTNTCNPRPAAIAYSTTAQMLTGAKPYRKLEFGSKIWGYAFQKKDGLLVVIWTTERGTISFKFKCDPKNVEVIDIMGNTVETPADKDSITLSLTGSPLFIITR